GTHYNYLVRGLLAKPLIAEDHSLCVSHLFIRQKTDDFIAQWKPTLDTLLDQIISEQQRANQLDRSRSNTLSPSQGS
ncbi:MAG TPA: hypothetical protein VLG38_06130, partial [Gammaproteobacteria bacterium]|nr:hypothetical protein [Gammaproteobacteria bacterium]